MTTPAFVVLTLALVCSTFGAAMEQTADQASEHTMHIKNSDDPNTSTKMRERTNNGNYVVNNQVDFNTFTIKKSFIPRKQVEGKIETVFENEFSIKNIDTEDFLKDQLENKNMAHYQDDISKYQTNKKYELDDIYTEKINDDTKDIKYNETKKENMRTLNYNINSLIEYANGKKRNMNNTKHDMNSKKLLKRVRRDDANMDEICKGFNVIKDKISHPHNTSISGSNYYSNVKCTQLVKSSEDKKIIMLTFVDFFHIEYHPDCDYDYLEIRDGEYGFSKSLGKLCGDKFPQPVYSTGPVMWLKFKSDNTIEYEGFNIKVNYLDNTQSYKMPDSCKIQKSGPSGVVDIADVPKNCKKDSEGHALEVVWEIEVEEGHAIYLNFTQFELTRPNECEENVVQVFGEITEEEKHLAHYCGSAANAVSTKSEDKTVNVAENKMTVRMLFSDKIKKDYKVNANFTAFRTLDPNNEEKCDEASEYDCEDNTCIDKSLACDGYAHCRLKSDEDPDNCDKITVNLLQQDHIVVILVIFSLIISGMSFIFLFKCIKKLYEDHKAIKEHIRQSTEDRLDSLMGGSLILDPNTLREPRASLERENHTNEIFNKQHRSVSQHKGLPQQTSIDSYRDTRLDLDDDTWHRDVESIPEQQDAKADRNGRTRRSDTSRKEESLRSRKESVEEKKEIRDAAVGAPDTKESGCQTRESLFQADTAPSSDGSNSASASRGFSTFGYSGATLVRPSPPPAPAPMISSTQIELLRQLPSFDTSHKPQKKMLDRRPMSAETTRSAPDVIIVSKPIR